MGSFQIEAFQHKYMERLPQKLDHNRVNVLTMENLHAVGAQRPSTRPVGADRNTAEKHVLINWHWESKGIHTELPHPECHQDLEITMENQLGAVMQSGRPGRRRCSRV